jgi:UDP-3-O-[3-hydroxymyristoyl] glucosamine N-acyltransferase
MILLGEIARALNLTLPAEANEKIILGAASLTEAGPEEISFFGDPRYADAFRRSRAGAILVPQNCTETHSAILLPCEHPGGVFAHVLEKFRPPLREWTPGIHPTAVVDPAAVVDPSASIQPGAVLEAGVEIGARTVIGAQSYIGHGAKIGDDCFLHPRVTVAERCLVGHRVILHSGVVLGSDGFGYQWKEDHHEKIPQTGIVQVDDDVEIGANTTVDRARFGRTHIGTGCKIDNLVQIGHNVSLGPHTILCSQVGISGSTRVGTRVTMAGKVGIAGHIEIADGITLGAMCGVTGSLKEKGGIFAGAPAEPIAAFRRNVVRLRHLGKLYERVAALEAALKASIQTDSANPAPPDDPA